MFAFVFGVWLKEKRLAQGLTQEELAIAVDVTRRTVINWEKGNTLPVLAVNRLRSKLCETLQVTAEELIDSLIGELIGDE